MLKKTKDFSPFVQYCSTVLPLTLTLCFSYCLFKAHPASFFYMHKDLYNTLEEHCVPMLPDYHTRSHMCS